MDFPNHYVLPLRHWHPHSETYSGGDSLLTALDQGWIPQRVDIHYHEISGRNINVYHITLQRRDKTDVMRVVNNPFVEQFVKTFNIKFSRSQDTTPNSSIAAS